MALQLSSALSTFAHSASYDNLIVDDQGRFLDAFINWIGCVLGGAQTATVEAAVRGYASWSQGATHIPLGRTERLALIDVISLDCLSSAALGFDDTHLETILHPTGPVAAALMGFARIHPVSGRQFLEALYVGMEVECRVGLAFASSGTGAKRGWYATGLAGGAGAATAVGRLMGLSEEQMGNALGLAASRASGNRGTHGAMAAAYVPSLAAESGFIAAQLTAAGFTCNATALDGNNGLLELVTDTPAIDRALDGLGFRCEAANNAFKPYPSGIIAHPVIDAVLALRQKFKLHASQVERLDLHVASVAADLGSRKYPKDIYEAAVSIPHWAAAVLVNGRAGSEEAGLKAVHNDAIRAVQSRIRMIASPELATDQCKAIVTLANGQTHEAFIEHAAGSKACPMSSADVDRKFLAQVEPALSPERAEHLLKACRNMRTVDDVRDLIARASSVGVVNLT